MKNFTKIIAIALCFQAFSCVAMSDKVSKVPKSDYSLSASVSTVCEFNIPSDAAVYYVITQDGVLPSFHACVGTLPAITFVPSGNSVYLKNLKFCYRSPCIDDKWKWQYSQLYNC